MTFFRIFLILALVLIAAPASAAEPDYIDGAHIIDRVDRAMRVNPSTAGIWYAGVANLDSWPARLERALLETLGPAELRETEVGLQTLRTLLKEDSPIIPVTRNGRDTLSVIVQLVETQLALAHERDRIARALEHEREAHRQTTDKLNALRQIDHQLDERESDGGR
ncbi:hypothetical protein G4Y73_11265 [Wenzhouxiangella sp. XN201]|uniref:hypothetical protein n=1 Tax=Wenzhouxiangella sp. XN201 TaxID=2710755 RepID=UPI0013CA0CA6|nr:hypothetical protein [Wenzhouxiangella sp. XN201]NEZ04732.1 hypothetical protein [Wenzhouxiangella sp. XN201]